MSETLFQRSCALGIPSGCTNRAAGILKNAMNAQPLLACTYKTFERTCRIGDPWGCTMQALQLSRGMGVERNREEALRVLDGSCLDGEDDPACSTANALRRELVGEQR